MVDNNHHTDIMVDCDYRKGSMVESRAVKADSNHSNQRKDSKVEHVATLVRLSTMRWQSDVDGGWAWVVALSSFFVFFILGGLHYTTSLFYVALLNHFEASHSYTAIVGSLTCSVYLLGGPVAARLLRSVGCRCAVICGALLIMTGYTIAAFASTFPVVLFGYGFVCSLGMCFCHTSTVVALSEHFERHLAAVTSFVLTGIGLGLGCASYILEEILATKGWRICFLVCAAVAIQLCVLGTLFFNTSVEDKYRIQNLQSQRTSLTNERSNRKITTTVPSKLKNGDGGQYSDAIQNAPVKENGQPKTKSDASKLKTKNTAELEIEKNHSYVTLENDEGTHTKSTLENNDKVSVDKHDSNQNISCRKMNSKSARGGGDESEYLNKDPADENINLIAAEEVDYENTDQYPSDWSDSENFNNIAKDKGTCNDRKRVCSQTDSEASVFQDIRLWLVNLSTLLSQTATLTLFVVYKDLYAYSGLTEHFTTGLSLIGVGDLIGRMSMGFITYSTVINGPIMYGASMLVISLVLLLLLLLSPHAVTWSLLSFLFGVMYGVMNVFLVLIPAMVFGRRNLSLVLGQNFFWGGVGVLGGPPFAGLLVDLTGSYNGVLWFTSSCCAAAGLIMMAVHWTTVRRRNSLIATL